MNTKGFCASTVIIYCITDWKELAAYSEKYKGPDFQTNSFDRQIQDKSKLY